MTENAHLIGYYLERCLLEMTRKLSSNFAEAGIDLPYSQYIVMRALHKNGPQSQAQIAHFLNKDTAAIKRTLDYLEKRGLVIRNKVSGRENIVNISDKGCEMMPLIIKVAESTIKELLNGVPDETIEIVLSFLMSISAKK